MALDENYISADEFDDTYEKATRNHVVIYGLINYLREYEQLKTANQ